MRGLLSAVAALACMVPIGVDAQDAEWNRYTLEKLGGVFIRIEADDVCRSVGVTASDFEAATSLHLIEAEVGVLTREQMLEHPALPELRVSFECATGAGDAMAYVVGLRVQQAAQMLRDTQITLPESVTWYATKLGVTATGNASSALEAALSETLGEFVVAWNAANADDEGSR